MRIVVLVTALAAATALTAVYARDPEPKKKAEKVLTRLDHLVTTSQQTWKDEDLEVARSGLRTDPGAVIGHLVQKLTIRKAVAGLRIESQIYQVSGNALTLLERLTDYRICGLGRAWIGFKTHDHRGAVPSPEKVYGPWMAWLDVRKDLPEDRWFWGLSYAEFERIQPLFRYDSPAWTDEALAPVRELGPRAYPYLLDKLTDNESAGEDVRYCDRANELLAKLTGHALPPIARSLLLRIDPDHPDRKYKYGIRRNEASMQLVREQWATFLLTGR